MSGEFRIAGQLVMENRYASRTDHQIISLLKAIKEISEHVKSLFAILETMPSHDTRRTNISITILDHLERLANLNVLQSAHLSRGAGQEIVEMIHASMIDVHKCLARTTAALVLGRVATVRDRALSTICTGHCQLGISHHFKEILDNVDQVIQALGISENLTDTDRTMISDTRQSVVTLSEMEEESWTLPVFHN